jgi:hypothetical protein
MEEALDCLEDLVVVDAQLCREAWVAICRASSKKGTLQSLRLAGMYIDEQCLRSCTALLHERAVAGLRVRLSNGSDESESGSESGSESASESEDARMACLQQAEE